MTSIEEESVKNAIQKGVAVKKPKKQKAAGDKSKLQKIIDKRQAGKPLTKRELAYLSDYLSSQSCESSGETEVQTTVTRNKAKYQTENIFEKAANQEDQRAAKNATEPRKQDDDKKDEPKAVEPSRLASQDVYQDVNDFRRTTAGSEINEDAAGREPPDVAIVEQVKASGVNEAMRDYVPGRGTTVVRTKEQARQAIKVLKQFKDRIHAWDTETVGIDPKVQSAVGHGTILCAQCFIGPDVDFGNGPRLFIDNYADAGDLIQEFKEYLEDPEYLKCWHNYGFDRHILQNHAIHCRGFGGDTMHMARLADPSRFGYGLKALTQELEPQITAAKKSIISWMLEELQDQIQARPEDDELKRRLETLQHYEANFLRIEKIDIRSTFGFYKQLASGVQGKILLMPDLEVMHCSTQFVPAWVEYSCFDAEILYFLRETLSYRLAQTPTAEEQMGNMLTLYVKYWQPFGELLTDMEQQGMLIDRGHLRKAELEAAKEWEHYENEFLQWVYSSQEDAADFNASSVTQMRQLLFAPFSKEKDAKKEAAKKKKEKKEGEPIDWEQQEQVMENQETQSFRVENLSGHVQPGATGPRKFREMKIKGFGLKPISYSASGMPQADANVIAALAGRDPRNGKFGLAYQELVARGLAEEGERLSIALDAWLKYKHIEKLLSTYLKPLQGQITSAGRIHCSMNLNTETGRLSCRKPNLQNQPALDKDKYQVRKAFIAAKGKSLVVADYGQLELRILAHMTKCRSMLEAFKLGGDFHSRTALGMYPEIQKALKAGDVLLEWDYSQGEPPKPLLKDKFANERKKAKIMNFSIAYGKTAHGFAKDWNCSEEEARNTVALWYSDRPEVRLWQDKQHQIAREQHQTKTLLGRDRNLRKHFIKADGTATTRRDQAHALRAAINTPIQGGAADIVMAAMVKIHKDEKLRDLGFVLQLQIHDEVILEGPTEYAEQAKNRLVEIMQYPLDQPLLVKLEVDANVAGNWYEAK